MSVLQGILEDWAALRWLSIRPNEQPIAQLRWSLDLQRRADPRPKQVGAEQALLC